MNLGKKISQLWSNILCFFLGHTGRTICQRCGKKINHDKNGNLWHRFKFNNLYLAEGKEYKGSVKLKTGMRKYELNLKTNELRLLSYDEETDSETGKVKRNAVYNPFCCYIDAINDKNALRKANAIIREMKTGVHISEVTPCEK